jgi:hypothetical protein
MSFQAGVGTWFAAYVTGELPVGRRFGLANTAVPTVLQFETGEFLDDIVIRQSDGGSIFVQCKTHPNLSAATDSALAATILQLVSFLVSRRNSTGAAVGPNQSITAYLKNAGTLEHAQTMANHSSPRTTQLYDRRQDDISLDEVERISI